VADDRKLAADVVRLLKKRAIVVDAYFAPDEPRQRGGRKS
jgi:hypothetical protein